MVSYGITSASCTVIGNSIGSGDVKLAKNYFKILLVFTFVMVSLEAYIINVYGYLLIDFFTDIVEIKVKANEMIPLLILNVFPEAVYGCLSGVLRGLGRQQMMLNFHIVCQGPFNIACLYYFIIVMKYDLFGIWIAKVMIESMMALMYSIVIACQDWDLIAEEAK